MGYIGKVPADVLIDPHVDSAAITDGTIITADIANDAVTSAKLAQNSVDSSELIDGSVDNSHLAGSIAMNKTLLSAGTGLTLSTNTLNVDAAQSQITSVCTLTGLTVQGSNYTTLSIQAGTTSHGAILNLGDSGDIDYGSITQFGSGAGEGGRMRFKAGTTEVLNLYSNGNSTFAGAITQGSGTLTIKNASGDSNGLKIYQDSSDVARIYNHYNGELVFGVSNIIIQISIL